MTIPRQASHMRGARKGCLLALLLLPSPRLDAQFIDRFDSLSIDRRGVDGWTYFSGDGSATISFAQAGKGFASIDVDARNDTLGIWWGLIRRRVSAQMNLGLLTEPRRAFRIEARIKVSHAPRRLNLHLNTQRTTDFHSHLMEFDIPDTAGWHTISMTTRGFDARPGDSVYGQLALMDWGLERYRVLLDYLRVDIVKTDSAGPDKGVQVPYHPPVPSPSSFDLHEPVSHDAIIDRDCAESNFNLWSAPGGDERTILLTVGGSQWVILRWDLARFAGGKVVGSGLLELTTYDLQRLPERGKDFGMVRVAEISGGEPAVVNGQMIIDIDIAPRRGGSTLATISQPVLQRMIDGTTGGLALKPLGAVQASFYALENRRAEFCAKLHFTLDHHGTGDLHDKRH